MKRIFIVLLLAVLVIKIQAVDGQNVLRRAFEESAICNLKVQMRNPLPPLPKGMAILPPTQKLVFCRQTTKEGLNLRVDALRVTRRSEEVSETYIKNAEGIFGLAKDGFAAEIVEVPVLWFPELMFKPLTPFEMKSANYSGSKFLRNGRNCFSIIVTLPTSDDFLQKLTGEPPEVLAGKKKMYLAGRPFKYEFLIDAEEYIVVSRKHYNAQGKMIFALVFDSWESLSPKADLFKTPSGLKGKFIDQASFASRVLAKMIERQKTGWGEYLSKRSAPVIHWVLRNSFWLMMPVALLAITAIVVIRRLSNRRK